MIDDIQTGIIECNIDNQEDTKQKDCNGLINMNNDITLLFASYLNARDMLSLALSCRRFGAIDENENEKYGIRIFEHRKSKKFVLHRHSLMEEAARRELTKTKQQKRTVPWCRVDSWIGLFNNPEKMRNWRRLNAYNATGDRKDRHFLMEAMKNNHLELSYLRFPPDFDAIQNLIDSRQHPLLIFCTQGPKKDFGVSSGYCWDTTRGYLETVVGFKALLTKVETVFNIHFGLVSCRKFDWSKGPRNGMRLSRCSFGERKRMLFTSIDGNKATTLTLKNGSAILLSKDGEKLVSKIHPPYHLSDEDRAEDNIPRTDPNEPSDSLFLMLDVSIKESEESED